VPEQIVKFGVYLNFLADRVSNANCITAAGTAMIKIRDDPAVYRIQYDPEMCSAANLAFNRFREIGQTSRIDEGTLSTVGLTWNEISAWAKEMVRSVPSFRAISPISKRILRWFGILLGSTPLSYLPRR